MPTKLRVIVEINNTLRWGKPAKDLLLSVMPPRTFFGGRGVAFNKLSQQAQYEFLYERVPESVQKKMWLFREPAKIKPKDSKYKSFLRSWGFGDPYGWGRTTRVRLTPSRISIAESLAANLRTAVRRRVPTPVPPSQPENRPESPWVFGLNGQLIPRQVSPTRTIAWADASQTLDFFGGADVG